MSTSSFENLEKSPLRDSTHVLLLTSALLGLGLYFLVRYGGLWGENDTSVFAHLTQIIMEAGRLIPPQDVYSNGYGYQAYLAALFHLSGLELRTIQLILAPLLAAWLVLPAWLAYREFTQSPRAATLATVFLLVQPEFLFPILRGSHEKFTRGLMFLGLYLLLRSIRSRAHLRRFAAFIVLFYLASYALITFNNLMAFSFIAAIGLAMFLFWLVTWRAADRQGPRASLPQRLLIVIGSLLIIAFLFTFYAYPPAQEQLRLMQSVQDRVSSLLLQVEDSGTNPYTVVNAGWISPGVYLLVSLANWLLLGASALIWLGQSYRWLVKQQPAGETERLLWAFYGAFALQGALSILVDLSGAIAANLQHRMFPSFVMLAAPLTASWLISWCERNPQRSRATWNLLGVLIAILGILSVLKATNEPILSNYWVFYRPLELSAVDWAVQKQEGTQIWTDFNERLNTSYNIKYLTIPNNNELLASLPRSYIESYLISELTRYRSQRLGQPLPVQADSLRVYDNGEAAIYRRRPLTSFQR